MGLAAPAHPLEAATGSEWNILQLATTRHAGVLWWHSHDAWLIKMCLLVMVNVPGFFFWGSKQEGRQNLLAASIPSASDTFVFMLEFQCICCLPISSPSVFIPCQAGGVLSLGSCSPAQSCPTLCDPMDCSMPGFPGGAGSRLYRTIMKPKNWCFWTVVLEKALESLLECKEIKLVNTEKKLTLTIHWKDWRWSSNTWATWCKVLTHWKRPWCWERLKVGGEVGDRRWDCWMASLTQWIWVWANSWR